MRRDFCFFVELTLADRGAVGRLATGFKSGVVAMAEDYKAAKEHLSLSRCLRPNSWS